MTVHRFEVSLRAGERDVRGEAVRRVAATLGLSLPEVRVSDVYWVEGGLDAGSVERLAAAVVDPITEHVAGEALAPFIEVALHPGVTDPVAETLTRAGARLGMTLRAATGRRYTIDGEPHGATRSPRRPSPTRSSSAGRSARRSRRRSCPPRPSRRGRADRVAERVR